ncbi:MAG: DUF3293 domain-containing protein [Betaproteobacteria bacterium]|nr:DUF3293 domain-containing protein [Betaproteobacteria bacterium]
MSGEVFDALFRATAYRVATPDGPFDLRIGAPDLAFDDFLARQGACRWGIVTPCNPGARRTSEARNAEREKRFLDRIDALGWPRFEASNRPDAGDWPPEPGFLLLHADAGSLRDLAAEFGQLAFVAGERGAPPRLVWV